MQKISLSKKVKIDERSRKLTVWKPLWVFEKVILAYWLGLMSVLAFMFILGNHLINSEEAEIIKTGNEIIEKPCGNHTHDAIEIYYSIDDIKSSKLIRTDHYPLNYRHPKFLDSVRIHQNKLFKYTWHNNGAAGAILVGIFFGVVIIIFILILIIPNWEYDLPYYKHYYRDSDLWERFGLNISKEFINDQLDNMPYPSNRSNQEERMYYVRRALWFRKFLRLDTVDEDESVK